MAPAVTLAASELAIHLNPPLCANHNTVSSCMKEANNVCASCQLVQYCSKECQKVDWPRHKATCKSAAMKSSWTPGWHLESRKPVFVSDGPPLTQFGTKKYLWGNMPALDILKLKDNEGTVDTEHDYALLFAASGDPRNIIKTIAGLPVDHNGKCDVVVNDVDFDIVARNAIIFLIALYYDAKAASLQSDILPMIKDVCGKIKSKAGDSLQAKTFNIRGRTLRLILRKYEWMRLVTYFQVPEGLSAAKARALRRDITLAPSRIDYRERAMLQWPPGLRQTEMRFRHSGVLLPYGCSSAAFDTPSPTFFQTHDWPMMDNATPRAGWLHAEFSKHSLPAKADEFGAIFSLLHELILQFCERVKKVHVSFELFCINAVDIGSHIGTKRFDRIEIANICDRGYIGPQVSLQVFSPLLKDKAASPKATLLLLFLNAVKETDYASSHADKIARTHSAMLRTKEYFPSCWAKPRTSGYDPSVTRRASCLDLLIDWNNVFNAFTREIQLSRAAKLCGLRIKSKHTIVEPWLYNAGPQTTQKEFDVLCAASTSGFERYMELEKP